MKTKGSGAFFRIFSGSASGTEQRLQTEPSRNVGLPRLRTERLTSLYAPLYGLVFLRAKWSIHPGSPVADVLSANRSGQGVPSQPWCGAAPMTAPSPVLRSLDQVGPKGVAFDVAAYS